MTHSTEASGNERREEPRFEVDLDATLRAYRVAPVSARMIDFSRTGCLLRVEEHDYCSGDEVLLSAIDIEAVATIAWIRMPFLGLAFHRRLDTHHVAALKKARRG
jgi:PilZ domain